MMKSKLFPVLCLCIVSSCTVEAKDAIVHLPLGTVKGLIKETVKGTQFYSFQGIPYAEKPIGDLRFQAPAPKKKWNEILNATADGNSCHQIGYRASDQSEDCLFINVFSPDINANLPVIFFIYGGSFKDGSANAIAYGPDFLIEQGVVLVTFNYRLGPYGFLSTGDEWVPGNAGLKDQNMALKWTNQYIKYFGGDRSKITIFGQSAGAASCAYHILSPLSEGLFRGAILFSGTSLSPWAYQRNHQVWTSHLIENMDPDNYKKYDTSQKIYEYLKEAPAELISNASVALQSKDDFGYLQLYQGFFFAPVYEQEHEGAFLTKKAYEALDKGDFNKVTVLLGATSEEDYSFTNNKDNLQNLAKRFTEANDTVPDDMHAIEENKNKIKYEIMKFYTSGGTYVDNPRNAITLMSDHNFVKSVLKFTEFLVKHSQNPYLYKFSYKGVLGFQTNQSEKGFSDIVNHGEDLRYIFSASFTDMNTTGLSKFPEEDQLVQNRFTTMMANFAKHLDPTPEKDEVLQNIIWPKTDSDFTYLDIGSDMEVKKKMKYEMYDFWNNLYGQYGVPPFDTY